VLQASIDFGYRFDDGTGLVAQLVEYMMSTAPQDASPGEFVPPKSSQCFCASVRFLPVLL